MDVWLEPAVKALVATGVVVGLVLVFFGKREPLDPDDPDHRAW
jgi:hypothetical protein